jgi:Na+(H+)/acetate symporter ActP
MTILQWTWILTGLSFAVYIYVAYWARAKTTGDFYVAEKSVPPLLNGMATGADWMSAASFISMAGLISFLGRDGSYYLMGWTGGYVLLALLFAPYLRKYGKFTIPQFIGDRYYSKPLASSRCSAPFSSLSPTWRARCVASAWSFRASWMSKSTPASSSAWRWSSSTPPWAA